MIKKLKFLHVGHHKCGSTFLQYEVIPKIRALQQPPGKKPDGTSNTEFRRAWIALSSQGDGGFDYDACAKEFAALDFNCYSNEALLGFGTGASLSGALFPLAARRLHRLFGETNILIVIRNQKKIVPSIYLDDIEYGLTCNFEHWVKDRHFHYQLDWFRYAPIIETYQTIFGRERVHVVLFEDLFNKATIARLLEKFGVPSEGLEDVNFDNRVNPGLSKPAAVISRLAFKRFGTRANMGHGRTYRYWIDYVRPALNQMPDFWGAGKKEYHFEGYPDILHNVYHTDNRRTSELIEHDLHARGYP